MGAIEDEKAYALLIRESVDDGSDFTNPPADYRRLFVGEDGDLHLKDSAGAVTDFAPSGGAAVDQIVRKTADEVVNNSSALQDDNHLLFAMLANEVWIFEGDLWYDSGTTPDLKIAFTVPAGATIRWSSDGDDAAGNAIAQSLTVATSGGTQTSFGNAVGTIRSIHVRGFVANGANAGNLQLQWAQNTANASDSTLRANSHLRYRKIA